MPLTNPLGDANRMTLCHIASSWSLAKMIAVLGELYKGGETIMKIVLQPLDISLRETSNGDSARRVRAPTRISHRKIEKAVSQRRMNTCNILPADIE